MADPTSVMGRVRGHVDDHMMTTGSLTMKRYSSSRATCARCWSWRRRWKIMRRCKSRRSTERNYLVGRTRRKQPATGFAPHASVSASRRVLFLLFLGEMLFTEATP